MSAINTIPAAAASPLVPSSDYQADAAIVSGLQRWQDAVRAYMAHPGDGENAEWVALLEKSEGIREAVMRLPVGGAEGMAIKAYLALHRELGNTTGEFEIAYDGGSMIDDGTVRQTIADAVRLSPALAELLRPN